MENRKSEYARKLLDPRWQKKRLEVLERDMWACQICFNTKNTLHVHHRAYESGLDPWEYELACLVTLCADCHAEESESQRETDAMVVRHLRVDLRLFNADMDSLAGSLACLPVNMVPPDIDDFLSAMDFLCRLAHSRNLNKAATMLAHLSAEIEDADPELSGNMRSLFGNKKLTEQ